MPRHRRKPELRIGDLVIVEWRDAATDSGWMEREKIEDLKPIVYSIGWVQRATKEAVTLGADIGNSDSECNRRLEVPSGMVQRVMLLSRPKKLKTSKETK